MEIMIKGGAGGMNYFMLMAGPGVVKGPGGAEMGVGGGGMGGGGRGGEPIMEKRSLARKAKLADMKPQIIPLVLVQPNGGEKDTNIKYSRGIQRPRTLNRKM